MGNNKWSNLSGDIITKSVNNIKEEKKLIGYYQADIISDYDKNRLLKYNNNKYEERYRINNFIEGLEKRFGEAEVDKMINTYGVARFFNGGVIFPYFYTDDRLTTGKIIWFDDDLHRIHEKPFKWLHNLKTYYETKWYDNEYDRKMGYNPHGGFIYDFTANEFDDKNKIYHNSDGTDYTIETEKKFKLKMALFGHNLILNDRKKTICLVESEKTACVMSLVMPEYIWVGAGGKTYIQNYKFMFFANRKCLVFPDMSTDDLTFSYWKNKLEGYNNKDNCEFQLIDYYTDFVNKHYKEFSIKSTPEELLIAYKESGYDLADFVLEYNNNNIYIKFLRTLLKSKKRPKKPFQTTIW